MPDPAAPRSGSSLPSNHRPVWDRVVARVRQAELAADREAPSRLLRRRRRDAARTDADGRTPEQRRESRALRRVFLDLGDCYRDFRRRTGAAVSPEIRDAAVRFRRDLDLDSLVLVAVSLDRIESFSW
jgi:hypothetical protein